MSNWKYSRKFKAIGNYVLEKKRKEKRKNMGINLKKKKKELTKFNIKMAL